jgi:hypothetical protein
VLVADRSGGFRLTREALAGSGSDS